MYNTQITIFEITFVALTMLSSKLIPALYKVIVFIWYYEEKCTTVLNIIY